MRKHLILCNHLILDALLVYKIYQGYDFWLALLAGYALVNLALIMWAHLGYMELDRNVHKHIETRIDHLRKIIFDRVTPNNRMNTDQEERAGMLVN